MTSPLPDSSEHIRMHFANEVIREPFGPLFLPARTKQVCIIGPTDGLGFRGVARSWR